MKMRYAVVDSEDVVVNVILWDGVTEYDPGEGLALVRIQAEIGDEIES